MTKLLSLAASYREEGNNQQLVNLAAGIAASHNAHVTPIAYHALDVPLFKEKDGAPTIPPAIAQLEEKLLEADGLLLGTPEHNWSFPASLKNIIDWLSVLPSKPLNGKTALLFSASSSKRGGISGLQQLRVPLSVLGVWVHPQLVGIGNIFEVLKDGQLLDENDRNYLHHCVADFVATTRQMRQARAE